MRRRTDSRAARRPIGYWQEFNEWYRAQLIGGDRPPVEVVASWYEENATRVWPQTDDRPTWRETRLHAKCLRSTEEVKTYFQKYRAGKKEKQRSSEANETAVSGRSNPCDPASLVSLVSQHNARVARMALEGSRLESRNTCRGPPILSINPYSVTDGQMSPHSTSFSPASGPPTAMTVTTGINQVTTGSKVSPDAGGSTRQHGLWKPALLAGGPTPFQAPDMDIAMAVSPSPASISYLDSERGGGSLRSASMFVKSTTRSLAPEANAGLRCRSMFASRAELGSCMDLDSPAGPGFDFLHRPCEEELLHDFPGLDGPELQEQFQDLRGPDQPGTSGPDEHMHKAYGQMPFQMSLAGGGCEALHGCHMTPDRLIPGNDPHPEHSQYDSEPKTHAYEHGKTAGHEGRGWLTVSGAVLAADAGTVYFPSADWSALSGGSLGSGQGGGTSSISHGEKILPKMESLLAAQPSKVDRPAADAGGPAAMLMDHPSWWSHGQMPDMPSWVPPGTIPEEGSLLSALEEPKPSGQATTAAPPWAHSGDTSAKADSFADRVQRSLTGSKASGAGLNEPLPSRDTASLVRRQVDITPPGASASSPRRPRLYYEHIFRQQEEGRSLDQPPFGCSLLPQTQSAMVQTPTYGTESLHSPKGSLPASWAGTLVTTCQPGASAGTGRGSKPQSPFMAGLALDLSKDIPTPKLVAQQLPEQRSRSMHIPRGQVLDGIETPRLQSNMHRSGSCPGGPNHPVSSIANEAEANMSEEAKELGMEAAARTDKYAGGVDDESRRAPGGLGSLTGAMHASGNNPMQHQDSEEEPAGEADHAWKHSQSYEWAHNVGGDTLSNPSLMLPEFSGSALANWKRGEGLAQPSLTLPVLSGSALPSWKSSALIPGSGETRSQGSHAAAGSSQSVGAHGTGDLADDVHQDPQQSGDPIRTPADDRTHDMDYTDLHAASLQVDRQGRTPPPAGDVAQSPPTCGAPEQELPQHQNSLRWGAGSSQAPASGSVAMRPFQLKTEENDEGSDSLMHEDSPMTIPPSARRGHQVTTGSAGPHDSAGDATGSGDGRGSSFVPLPPQLCSPWGSPTRAMSCLLPPVSRCLKPGGRKPP